MDSDYISSCGTLIRVDRSEYSERSKIFAAGQGSLDPSPPDYLRCLFEFTRPWLRRLSG